MTALLEWLSENRELVIALQAMLAPMLTRLVASLTEAAVERLPKWVLPWVLAPAAGIIVNGIAAGAGVTDFSLGEGAGVGWMGVGAREMLDQGRKAMNGGGKVRGPR